MAKEIEIKKPVKTIRGKDVKEDGESGKLKSLTYGDVIVELLANPNRKGKDLMRCWRLAQKMVDVKKDTVTIDDDEVELVKKIVEENFMGKNPQTGQLVEKYSPFVIAQIIDYLDLIK